MCFGQCVKGTDCGANPPYSDDEMKTVMEYFVANINVGGNGAVVASPSKDHPDYYYHWMRDAAISMNILLEENTDGQYDEQIQSYVQWVHKVQMLDDPNGIDVLGEPKFFMDGRVYTGGWMRPQNDGAALRAVTLINYANKLIAAGQKDWVLENLYSFDIGQPGIKKDVDYAARIWSEASGDPWEELRTDCFFTKISQRHALVAGAELADALGDHEAADSWRNAVGPLSDSIQKHWNEGSKFYEEASERPLDSAVHLGILYGDAGDGFLSASSERAQSSAAALWDYFIGDVYPINKQDDQENIPGLLVGRYPNDHYDGYSVGGSGNPWILCTFSLAEMYYRNAEELAARGEVSITDTNHRFFQQVTEKAHPSRPNQLYSDALTSAIASGNKITLSEHPEVFSELLDAVVGKGDSLALRVHHHTKGLDHHFNEQLNLENGGPQGANDLTWSYGTLIAAMQSRKRAVATLRKD